MMIAGAGGAFRLVSWSSNDDYCDDDDDNDDDDRQ